MRTFGGLLLGVACGAWITGLVGGPQMASEGPFVVGGTYSPVAGSRDCVVRIDEIKGEWLRLTVVSGCRDKFTELHAHGSHDAPIWYYPAFGQTIRGPIGN